MGEDLGWVRTSDHPGRRGGGANQVVPDRTRAHRGSEEGRQGMLVIATCLVVLVVAASTSNTS